MKQCQPAVTQVKGGLALTCSEHRGLDQESHEPGVHQWTLAQVSAKVLAHYKRFGVVSDEEKGKKPLPGQKRPTE